MAIPVHLEVEGKTQGKIEGSCDMEGRVGTILVYAVQHKIHIPRDPQAGQPSGKRIHGPLTILKETDKSSPKLYQALVTGERMSNVTIKWYRISAAGTEEHYFTHTLENAIIVSIEPDTPTVYLPENEAHRHMERVSFTYEKIKWTWEIDGIEAEDSWKVPKA
jgi:type VI secretion system secreted protein Hcp